jgi:predicted metalloprotease with PDZ domain
MIVEVRFKGDADGETRFFLPSKWAGSSNLRSALSEIKVTGASWKDEGEDLLLRHRPGAPIVVRYRVSSAYSEDPGRAYDKARPVIRPDWFLLMGEGVFGRPENRDSFPATFSWGRFPSGWRVASDLDHLAKDRPGTVADIIESVAIGGRDLTVVERSLGGKRIRIAARGKWPFPLNEFSERMLRILEAQNNFWHDSGRPFLVVLAPLTGGSATETFSNGTGRSDAFAFAASTNQEFKDIVRILSHESMHSWIASEIGGPLPVDEALGYWLSEGFDDYAAARILLRTGDWSLEDYVAELNKVLRRYALSPARGVTNREIGEKFWTNSDVERMPYDRGHLLALLIDGKLRERSGGQTTLDDVLLAQAARAGALRSAGHPIPAAQLLPIVAREKGGLDISDLLDRHIERGEPLMLPENLFGPCARVETRHEPVFEYGFDLPATRAAGYVVRGLDSSTPAYAAGLREGMKIVRTVSSSRETGEIVFAVAGDPEKRIAYLRRRKGENLIQQVVLAPTASGEAKDACRRRMGGG